MATSLRIATSIGLGLLGLMALGVTPAGPLLRSQQRWSWLDMVAAAAIGVLLCLAGIWVARKRVRAHLLAAGGLALLLIYQLTRGTRPGVVVLGVEGATVALVAILYLRRERAVGT